MTEKEPYAELPAREPSEAENLAEAHVVEYALSQVMEPKKGEKNLLSAALICACRGCVGAYLGMLNWLTQDWDMAKAIAKSHGVNHKDPPPPNPFAGGWWWK